MSLLGAGYDSEGEESGEDAPTAPLQAAEEEVEAPLKKARDAAQLAANPVGQSLLAALPPPKVTLGKETSSSIRLDLSDAAWRAQEKSRVPVEGLLRPENFADDDEEAAQVPANVLNHPMFSTEAVQPDGPSAEDLLELRKPRQFVEVNAEDMKDPDWYMKDQMNGGPGYLTKKRVSDDMSMYDGKGWRQTTHANPSRVQKRKHHINWQLVCRFVTCSSCNKTSKQVAIAYNSRATDAFGLQH
ncbi:Protein RIK [Durusdinium trenchii]|uniref:Protein RIK n=1 Tax=Durusdinium trenchii TaxID=1381693 RepID=A0ABP0SAS6_9DINO